jgi:hypothetical protein
VELHAEQFLWVVLPVYEIRFRVIEQNQPQQNLWLFGEMFKELRIVIMANPKILMSREK